MAEKEHWSRSEHAARFIGGPWVAEEKRVLGFPLNLYVPGFSAYHYALWVKDSEGTLVYQWVVG